MLQARVNLYKGDWDKAYDAAKEVIDQSPYQWFPGQYVNYWKEEGAAETILELFACAIRHRCRRRICIVLAQLVARSPSAGATLIPTTS